MENGKNDNKKTFWIVNISNRNVTLSDLNVSIPAGRSVDLLSKNYYLTEGQLNKSVESGSIFKKRDKIVKRLVAPGEVKKPTLDIDREAVLLKPGKSIYEIKQDKYDELEVTDEELASQNADLKD